MNAVVCVVTTVLGVLIAGALVVPVSTAAGTTVTPVSRSAEQRSTADPIVPGTVVSVPPTRVVDSRIGLQLRDPIEPFGTGIVRVSGCCGIPATGFFSVVTTLPANGVAAVVLTVTVVAPRAAGYATVWPSGAATPGTSNLNFTPGRTVATTTIVPVGPDGRIQVLNGSAGSADVIVDVTGYTLG